MHVFIFFTTTVKNKIGSTLGTRGGGKISLGGWGCPTRALLVLLHIRWIMTHPV